MCEQATHVGMQKAILQQRCSICTPRKASATISSAEHTKIHQRTAGSPSPFTPLEQRRPPPGKSPLPTPLLSP